MAKYKSEELLNNLAEDVKKLKECAEFFKDKDKNKLVYCPAKGKWSVVQALEHVNAYNRIYLPVIEKELSLINKEEPDAWFTPGLLGDLFTKLIRPKNVMEVGFKMKTSRDFSFPNSLNVDKVVQEYIDHQEKLMRLLDTAKKRDLNRIKIPLSQMSSVKLKLGDVFRFLIAHEQRHMIQARNTLRSIGEPTNKFPVVLQVIPR